jgi:hypothetical protein
MAASESRPASRSRQAAVIPDRSKPPVDLLEALRRALFGDLFDIVDAFGLEANED